MKEAPKTPQPITGLTLDQVLPLISGSKFGQRFVRDELEQRIGRSDFYSAAYDARRKVAGDKHSLYFSLDKFESPELKNFLMRNRPRTLFFEPQQIADLLTPDSDIVVAHETSSTFKKWQFTLNPKKFTASNDWASPDIKQTLTLVRGKAPNREDYPEDYLVVNFPARYDGSTITFYPDIGITYGDIIPREKLEQAMIKLLDLKEHSIPQQLEFEVKEEECTKEGMKRGLFGRTITKVSKWKIYPVEISLGKPTQGKSPDKRFSPRRFWKI